MVTVRKQASAYEIGYAVVVLQTFTMFLYMWYQGLFFFEVPKESRNMLILRSIIFAASYTLFIGSMSFLNPLIALICQQGGIVVFENVIRLGLRLNWIWNALIIKVSIVVVLLLPAWTEESSLVNAPLINNKTAHGDPHADPDWILEFRKHVLQAFLAGGLMCCVSRLSHILAKPGALNHESYMSAYGYLISACTMPLFIITSLQKQSEVRLENDSLDVSLLAKVGGFAILFLLILFKNFYLERAVMNRYTADYNPEIHERFPFNALSANPAAD